MKSHIFKLFMLIGIFLTGSIIINQSGIFSHTRLDLTENNLFTLNAHHTSILVYSVCSVLSVPSVL